MILSTILHLSFSPAGVFQLYDTDRDGYISRDEVEGVVSAMHRMLGHMTSLQEEEEEKEEMEEQETLQERVSSLWEIMDTVRKILHKLSVYQLGCCAVIYLNEYKPLQ